MFAIFGTGCSLRCRSFRYRLDKSFPRFDTTNKCTMPPLHNAFGIVIPRDRISMKLLEGQGFIFSSLSSFRKHVDTRIARNVLCKRVWWLYVIIDDFYVTHRYDNVPRFRSSVFHGSRRFDISESFIFHSITNNWNWNSYRGNEIFIIICNFIRSTKAYRLSTVSTILNC